MEKYQTHEELKQKAEDICHVLQEILDLLGQNKVMINFNTGGGSYIAPMVVYRNQSFGMLPIPYKEGRDFDGWYFTRYTDSNGQLVYLNKIDNLTTVVQSGTITLYAKWNLSWIEVRLNPTNGTVQPDAISVQYNTTFGSAYWGPGFDNRGLPVPRDSVLTFSNWRWMNENGELEDIDNGTPFVRLDPPELSAVWKTRSFTLYYDPNGATGEIQAIHDIELGSQVTLLNWSQISNYLEFPGKTFIGWSRTYYAQDIIQETPPMDRDLSVHAIWENRQYSIQYFDIDGKFVTSSTSYMNVPDQLLPLYLLRLSGNFEGFDHWNSNVPYADYLKMKDEDVFFNLTTVPNSVVRLSASSDPITSTLIGFQVFGFDPNALSIGQETVFPDLAFATGTFIVDKAVQIEYLETVGTENEYQWIDTGIPYSQDIECSACASFGIPSKGSYNGCDPLIGVRNYQSYQIGAYYANGTKSFSVAPGGISYDFKINGLTSSDLFNKDIYFDILYNGELSAVCINGTEYQKTITGSGSETIKIFYRGDDQRMNGRIKAMRFRKKSTNTILLDLVPVRVGDEGYLYDKISKRLLGNSGNGKFILGFDIEPLNLLTVEDSEMPIESIVNVDVTESLRLYPRIIEEDTKTVYASFKFNGDDTHYVEYPIIAEPVPEKLTIVSPPNKTLYRVGDILDLTGFEVEVVSSGNVATALIPNIENYCTPRSGHEISSVNDNVVMVSYPDIQGIKAYQQLKVEMGYPVISIDISNGSAFRTRYSVGESLDTSGIEIVGTLSIDSGITGAKYVTSECVYYPTENLQLSNTTIYVYYKEIGSEISTSFDIEMVGDLILLDAEIDTPPALTSYSVGDVLDIEGLKLKLHWNSNETEVVEADAYNGSFHPALDASLNVNDREISIEWAENNPQQIKAYQPILVSAETSAWIEFKLDDSNGDLTGNITLNAQGTGKTKYVKYTRYSNGEFNPYYLASERDEDNLYLEDAVLSDSVFCYYSVGENDKLSFTNQFLDDQQKLISIDFSGLDSISIESIAGIFQGCSRLSSVILPSSLIAINDYAFTDCTSLSSLSIRSSSLMLGGNSSFQNCTSLTSIENFGVVDLNDSSIVSTFVGCSNLISIDLSGISKANGPQGSMFLGCSNLKKISTNDVAIYNFYGYGCFNGCSSLSTIAISSETNVINDYAFYGCENVNLGNKDVLFYDPVILGTNCLYGTDLSITISCTSLSNMAGNYSTSAEWGIPVEHIDFREQPPPN